MNRIEAIANIRMKLQSGMPTIGSWMQIPHASVAEIMGQSGYNWVAVDMEHGSIDGHQLPDLFRALELGGTLPMVRLSQGSTMNCKQALDAGAGGVIVPMVETATQLGAIRDAICWPPAGKRGVGFSRANLFGKNFESYAKEAQAPLLVAMIEHTNAVENIEAILQVDGLDAIFIGPYDLSASLGLTGQFDHPVFQNEVAIIKARCAHHKVACGIHVVKPSLTELKIRIDQGFQFLAYSIDAVILGEGAIFEQDNL